MYNLGIRFGQSALQITSQQQHDNFLSLGIRFGQSVLPVGELYICYFIQSPLTGNQSTTEGRHFIFWYSLWSALRITSQQQHDNFLSFRTFYLFAFNFTCPYYKLCTVTLTLNQSTTAGTPVLRKRANFPSKVGRYLKGTESATWYSEPVGSFGPPNYSITR